MTKRKRAENSPPVMQLKELQYKLQLRTRLEINVVFEREGKAL